MVAVQTSPTPAPAAEWICCLDKSNSVISCHVKPSRGSQRMHTPHRLMAKAAEQHHLTPFPLLSHLPGQKGVGGFEVH
ncbi:unnamed protein product [Pleuronectes platessa]|uniref:Uncharacterized protein n=1 Tax=Pleuronectes platessa TaxID=8262 RepID=A0A9N7Z948_PLEPL|nr:unnamed protein product [Pleuronectes platessa]